MLNIFLGYACNLGCTYCLQAPASDRDGAPRLRTDLFIERVIPLMRAKGITRIAWWGGEPLVYWRHIRDMHDAIDRAGIRLDLMKLATNATLLDDEHVEQLNRWDAQVIVSRHAGFGAPRWDQVMRLRSFNTSFLFTGRSLLAWEFLDECRALEQSWGRRLFPYIHWVRATNGATREHWLELADLDVHVPHLWTLARIAAEGDPLLRSAWRGHLYRWRDAMARREMAPMCYGDHQIDIDLEGNRYGCHHWSNAETRIGHWGGAIENYAALDHVHRWIRSAECRSCPINVWCRGNCHLSQTHEVDCALSKRKHEILAWLDRNWGDDSDAVIRFTES